ncbi:hypothetical protein V5E97_07705 [Singulisphaera sp. Ch08]|uniref:Peptidylprolyl isomerase n=1 Tax=Singulisphaera sp. Ch08 TaxID=3120278 RepID=A0AAU7CL77_9BACT
MTRLPRAIRLLWLIPLLAFAGCNGGEEVTKQSIAKARKVWSQAGIDDYDLDWTSAGTNNAYYRVTVRNGRVRRLEQVLPDGRTVELHPGKPEYFGVDGLFLTMAEEHAQLGTDRPFGQAKGSKAVLLFTPDLKYGYPRSYRRDIVGATLPVAIDVVRFVPNPPRSKPSLQ